MGTNPTRRWVTYQWHGELPTQPHEAQAATTALPVYPPTARQVCRPCPSPSQPTCEALASGTVTVGTGAIAPPRLRCLFLRFSCSVRGAANASTVRIIATTYNREVDRLPRSLPAWAERVRAGGHRASSPPCPGRTEHPKDRRSAATGWSPPKGRGKVVFRAGGPDIAGATVEGICETRHGG